MDDVSAVGLESRCDQFCEDLGRLVPVNNLGELRWYGCRFRGIGMLVLPIFRKTSFRWKHRDAV